jgi:hypothetical protein
MYLMHMDDMSSFRLSDPKIKFDSGLFRVESKVWWCFRHSGIQGSRYHGSHVCFDQALLEQ